MFKRRESNSPAPDSQPTESRPGSKGHATPSRKEAEAARKQSLRVPKDPKAARAAAKERDRQARLDSRAGLMAGDERYLPARDRGPVRRYVRDFVDSKYSLAEYFIFIAVGILVLGFVPNATLNSIVSIAWFAVLVLVVIDSGFMIFRLQRALRTYWPDAKDRKGVTLYAMLRLLQLRRLRLPKPQIARGAAVPAPKLH